MTERKRSVAGVLAYLSIMMLAVIVITVLMNIALTAATIYTARLYGEAQLNLVGNIGVAIKNCIQNFVLILSGVLYTVSGKSESKKLGFSPARAILFSAVSGIVFTAIYYFIYLFIKIDYDDIFLDALVTLIVYSILPLGFIFAFHMSFRQKLHCHFTKDRIIGTVVFVLVIIGLYWGSAYFVRTDYLAGNIIIEKYLLIIKLFVLIMRILLLITVSFMYYPQVRSDSKGGEFIPSQDDIPCCGDTRE